MSRFRLGIFVVLGLAILAGGIFLIGSNHLTFRSTYRLETQFDNVAGLNNGAEVRVGGMHEGTVAAIDLPNRPDGKVTVVMVLADRTHDVLKKDSVASIQAEGLIGDEFVEISFGSVGAPPVKSGDTIASQPPFQMSQLFNKANGILDQVNSVVGNLNGTSKDLEAIGNKINNGQGTVGALVNSPALYQKMTSGVSALQEDAEALKHNFLLRGFFKKRGFEDASQLTQDEIRQLPSGGYSKMFEIPGKRLFENSANAHLKPDGDLKQVGEYLQDNPFGLAVVAGVSGMKGDSQKDETLTLARAAVVRDYLAKNYRMNDTNLKTIGMGKTPGAPDDGEIQVFVYPQATPPAANRH